MKLWKLILALALSATPAFAQISGAGALGCNAVPVTGTGWTSGTSLNATQVLASNIAADHLDVVLVQTSTISGGAVNFLVDYGDGNYVTAEAYRVLDPTTVTWPTISTPYTLVASTNKKFVLLTQGVVNVQLKLTTAITGSATVTPYTTAVCTPLPLAFQASAANLSANIGQFGGSNVATGTGASGSGVPRVTVSNDSSLAANQSVNESQINGVTPLMNNGASGTGSQRMNIANDNSAIANWGQGAIGSAVPANGVLMGGKGSGNLTAPIVCDNWTPFSLASTTALKLVSKASSKQVYICSIDILVAGANNVALIEGTKTTTDCDTSAAGMAGGATAATGWNFAANSGITHGNGIGAVAATATANHDVCLLASATTQVSGVISWTQF